MSEDTHPNRRRAEADAATRRIHRIAEPWGTRTPYGRFQERYPISGGAEGDNGEPGLLGRLREKGSEMVGRRPESGLLLLRDLRKLYILASEASINWVILGQGAQAAKDRELLQATKECHPDTLRTLKWTNTKIKETSPQVLMS